MLHYNRLLLNRCCRRLTTLLVSAWSKVRERASWCTLSAPPVYNRGQADDERGKHAWRLFLGVAVRHKVLTSLVEQELV